MSDITAVIVDDEVPARRTLRLLLSRHEDVTIAGECGTGPAALAAIARTRPDLVFLDIQIPGMDGFEVLRRLGPRGCPAIVFVTAFDEYAVRAFEAHAIDYLLKPFSDERFEDVLAHARRAIRLGRSERFNRAYRPVTAEAATGAIVAPGRLVVRDGYKTVMLPWPEIEWIEAESYYSRIHAGTRRPLVRRSLTSLMDALAPGPFLRVHRSAVVNLDHVREVRPGAGGDQEAVLSSGTVVRVSRRSRAALAARLPASVRPVT